MPISLFLSLVQFVFYFENQQLWRSLLQIYGTSFWFTLPDTKPSTPPLQQSLVIDKKKKKYMKKGWHILLIRTKCLQISQPVYWLRPKILFHFRFSRLNRLKSTNRSGLVFNRYMFEGLIIIFILWEVQTYRVTI
jgi:hypothetical protein